MAEQAKQEIEAGMGRIEEKFMRFLLNDGRGAADPLDIIDMERSLKKWLNELEDKGKERKISYGAYKPRKLADSVFPMAFKERMEVCKETRDDIQRTYKWIRFLSMVRAEGYVSDSELERKWQQLGEGQIIGSVEEFKTLVREYIVRDTRKSIGSHAGRIMSHPSLRTPTPPPTPKPKVVATPAPKPETKPKPKPKAKPKPKQESVRVTRPRVRRGLTSQPKIKQPSYLPKGFPEDKTLRNAISIIRDTKNRGGVNTLYQSQLDKLNKLKNMEGRGEGVTALVAPELERFARPNGIVNKANVLALIQALLS